VGTGSGARTVGRATAGGGYHPSRGKPNVSRSMNTEYFWWLAALVAVAAGGLVVVLGWRDRGGLDALAPRDDEPETAPASHGTPGSET
jgi:hypothetical protein